MAPPAVRRLRARRTAYAAPNSFFLLCAALLLLYPAAAFLATPAGSRCRRTTTASSSPASALRRCVPLRSGRFDGDGHSGSEAVAEATTNKMLAPASNRREALRSIAVFTTFSTLTSTLATSPNPASALGSLPELASTNAILQGLTIDVSDASQESSTVQFLLDAFDFTVLRRRKLGSVSETWLGFGPEQLSQPDDFEVGVSSFARYGGHASLCVRYDSKTTKALYRRGDEAPGDNVAYLQVGVPTYRISQMVKNGGNVLDAYGYVNVIMPCGLPLRGIVGIWPDPIMFVAINCKDVAQSRKFYEQLGFVEQEYPYARPSKGTGQFEPPQPPKSVYLAPSPNSMGVLLLPSSKRGGKVTPNPVLRSLNVVYAPSTTSSSSSSEDASAGGSGGGGGAGGEGSAMGALDPSGVPVSFVPVDKFEKEERLTRTSVDLGAQ